MKLSMKLKEFYQMMNAPTQKAKCFKCGKELEFPNPPGDLLKSWGCFSFAVFIIANLMVNGWHVRNSGITDRHPYFCPDCWDNSEPEYQKHPKTDEWVEKGKEWLKSKKEEQI